MNKLRKAVFFDRDGVINKNRPDYVKTVEELEIFPYVAKSIKQLKKQGYLVVVITNQSAINRGLTDDDKVSEIHQTIQKHLLKHSSGIDAFYYCPHRPDENCVCRKPKPGLLLKASQELEIDLKSSWMIGDNESDIQAAESVGCKALKIRENFQLKHAVQSILNS
ncbi:MAG: HAD family hydrolase [Thaumarchaeota archaeon]|nr:HAD family hydrolase [Nitrososphaerota archaeon]